MKRREFIELLGCAAATWPVAAHAQRATPSIGVLSNSRADQFADRLSAFRRGLAERGFVEERNVSIQFRWADESRGRLPALAADLVGRPATVIFATDNAAGVAAKAATATIPIVFCGGANPARLGLVASLDRPGGNFTGVTLVSAATGPKRLELIRQIVPGASLFGVLANPTNPEAGADLSALETAAKESAVRLAVLNASNETELELAFAEMAQRQIRAMLALGDGFFFSRREHLASLTARYAIPAVYNDREFADAGGLMSYGISIADAFRQTGIYAGRVLAGESPSDMPIIFPSQFEFVVNLRTANALGIPIPPAVLAIADDVIE